MSNITLADYVGFIFSEINRARDHADKVAKEMAIAYAKDDVLKHFSVPRFKVPEMELTIPVLISSAKFSTTLSFAMTQADFTSFIQNRVNSCIQTLLIRRSNVDIDFTGINNAVFDEPVFGRPPVSVESSLPTAGESMLRKVRGKRIAAPLPTTNRPLSTSIPQAIAKFYQLLVANADPSKPENIAQVSFAEIFNAAITEHNLLAEYRAQYPQNEMFKQALQEVIQKIKDNTVVSQSKMENLLVNPETNVVKSGSTDATVFTIKAKIMEEGVFVKTVKNEETGEEELLVEFE
ncbi:hypothetical protein [Chitinophaga tropicalis]|uniref:Uncharacterized protein n=1 Tax=Chitinophaga tropicalis TaxID=2683588 RepID=A0A7K1U5F2_9BACT|nr:hypothetical protein [Chitinophaga tropicalis]MVT09594.1 hypothetical protein [Chitinophaga tropicalis]